MKIFYSFPGVPPLNLHYPGVQINYKKNTVEPQFNKVAGDRPNLFVKWRVCYIENLDITNFRGNDQTVRYIKVIILMIDL